MPYDIYGQDLRNGFCEVHPYVEQEYPCQICCQEIEREEQRQRENRERLRLQNEQYQQSLNPNASTIFNIDFGGHVMAGLKIVNGEIKVVGAINGYGDYISDDLITITNSNQ